MRFIAATQVIFSHSYPLTGFTTSEPIGQILKIFDGGAIGVSMFFAISGFLVSQSWDRRDNLLEFALARALRILPALIFAVVVTALLIGPMATRLSLGEYFASRLRFQAFLKTIRYGTRRTDRSGPFLWRPFCTALLRLSGSWVRLEVDSFSLHYR